MVLHRTIIKLLLPLPLIGEWPLSFKSALKIMMCSHTVIPPNSWIHITWRQRQPLLLIVFQHMNPILITSRWVALCHPPKRPCFVFTNKGQHTITCRHNDGARESMGSQIPVDSAHYPAFDLFAGRISHVWCCSVLFTVPWHRRIVAWCIHAHRGCPRT